VRIAEDPSREEIMSKKMRNPTDGVVLPLKLPVQANKDAGSPS